MQRRDKSYTMYTLYNAMIRLSCMTDCYFESTEDLLHLATATVKSIKRCHTITELVVVWSVCSVCTSVAKSKVVGPHIQLDTLRLQHFTLFALAVARSSKTSVCVEGYMHVNRFLNIG